MTSTRFSDRRGGFLAVFVWQLKRTLPAAALYWALMALVTLWGWITRSGYSDRSDIMEILITGFAFILPIVHLNDCFSRRKADYVHALPIPRGQIYLAALINSLWQILLPIVPCRLFTTYVMQWRLTHIEGGYNIRPLAFIAIALVGFAFMAASACGTYHGYVIGIVAHMASWRFMVALIYIWMNSVIPGVYVSDRDAGVFYCLGAPFGVDSLYMESITRKIVFTWLPIFGAICSAAGYILYKRRQSEQAGHFGQCRPAELFLRAEFTLAAGITAACGMDAIARDARLGGFGIPLTLLSMVIVLILAHVVLELVWRRRLKAIKSSAPALIIAAGALALATGLISTGLGLDTDIPEVSEVYFAQVYQSYPKSNYYMYKYVNVQPPEAAGDEDVSTLYPGDMSPEMLEKVREANKKYIELERAAQYPYLPGRNGYGVQEDWLCHYTVIPDDGRWNGAYMDYKGPINSRTEPLLEELRGMLWDISTSDEYIDALYPIVAIDAASSLASYTVNTENDQYEEIYGDTKPVSRLPKDFIEGLEEALREDMKNRRYITAEDVIMRSADEPLYRLDFEGEFTARGGTLWEHDSRSGWYVPAKGKRLKLYKYQGSSVENAFRVSKRTPATYAYLAKVYNQG